MKNETWLPGEIYKNRKLVFSLAKNDFKTKYAGSYFGTIWAFIQPIVTICVYWFVFGLALRNGSDKGVPFVLWLIAGLIPWFFFQEGLIGGTNALLEYNYLVKKVVFNIRILPVVKVFSAVFVLGEIDISVGAIVCLSATMSCIVCNTNAPFIVGCVR